MKNIFKRFKKRAEKSSNKSIHTKDDLFHDKPLTLHIPHTPTKLDINKIESEMYSIFMSYLRDNVKRNSFKILQTIVDDKTTNLYDLDHLQSYISDNLDMTCTIKESDSVNNLGAICVCEKIYSIDVTIDNIDVDYVYNYFRYCDSISDKEKLNMVVSYSNYIKNNIDSVIYDNFITENKSKLNTLTSIIIDSIADTSSDRTVKNLITLSFRNSEEKILLEKMVLSNIDLINRFYEDYNIKIEIVFSSICVNIRNLTQKENN